MADLSPIRMKAKAYIDRCIGRGLPMCSHNPATERLHFEYTGFSKTKLEDWWNGDETKKRKPKNLTSCQGFAGTYLNALGGPYIVGFDMDTKLAGAKYWMTPEEAYPPQYGDICLHANAAATGGGHISVMRGMSTDGEWLTIQGGGTGSGRDFWNDCVALGTGVWNPMALRGWIDLDKLFPDQAAIPQWMKGWWKVSWDEDVYYYYIGPDWSVQWTYTAPPNPWVIQVTPDGGRGKVSNPSGVLQINWNSGSVEHFWYGTNDWPMEFWGKHNGEGVLHVERLE